jgi:pimeloyl-ACP methyl ester carboxylesterase
MAAGSLEPVRNLVESYFVETTPRDIREQVRAAIGSCPPDVAAGMLDGRGALMGQVAKLIRDADRRPFMVFWGMNPPGRPENLRDITMFMRQEPIAEAGHFFQLEKPEVTTALLRAFVDDVNRDPRLHLDA